MEENLIQNVTKIMKVVQAASLHSPTINLHATIATTNYSK
jgi:hypothetical protein